jgi:hypothetical protein
LPGGKKENQTPSPITGICGHRRVRVGHADFLVPAALTARLLDPNIPFRLVLIQHIFYMPLDKALPTDIGTDEGGIDVHDRH